MNKPQCKIHPCGLLVSSDGQVFIPQTRGNPAHWTFGTHCMAGGRYRCVKYKGKQMRIHRLVAETFLENPEGLPCVDHIDRNPSNNDISNLRFVSFSVNRTNCEQVDKSIEKYGVRSCEDKAEYQRRYRQFPEVKAKIAEYNRKARERRKEKCA